MHRRHVRSPRPATRPWLDTVLAGGLVVHSLHFLLPLWAGGRLHSRVDTHHRGTLGLGLGIAPLLLGGAALTWPRVRRRVLVARW